MRHRIAELEKAEAGRKQVEQRLALAAAQWQDTFDAIEDPVMILDEDFRVVRANQAMNDAIEDPVMILDKDFRVVRANQAMNKAFAGAKVLGAHCYELFHGTEGS